jgi:BASS family bile acid:Na+ symporter
VLVLLSIVAIVATPLLLELVLPVPGPVELDRAQIIGTLLLLVIVPAASGILLRSLAPALANRLGVPVMTVSNAALAVVLASVMWQHHQAMLRLGAAALAAIVLVFAGSMAGGWLLTGPARATRFAGAAVCAARNAGIALLIVATNFPVSRIGDENTARVIATLVAYALFEVTAGYVLGVYHGRRTRAMADTSVARSP